jgi:hypothetical protein
VTESSVVTLSTLTLEGCIPDGAEDTILTLTDSLDRQYARNDDVAGGDTVCSEIVTAVAAGTYELCATDFQGNDALTGVVVSGEIAAFAGTVIPDGETCTLGDDETLCAVDLQCLRGIDGVRTCTTFVGEQAAGDLCSASSEVGTCGAGLECLSDGTDDVCGVAADGAEGADCLAGSEIENCAEGLACINSICIDAIGSRCDAAAALVEGANTVAVTQDGFSAVDCGAGGDGAERIFAYTNSRATPARITATVAGLDVQLSTRTTCEDAASQTICTDSQSNVVVAELAAGETAFIVLDAFFADEESEAITLTIVDAALLTEGDACEAGDICADSACVGGTCLNVIGDRCDAATALVVGANTVALAQDGISAVDCGAGGDGSEIIKSFTSVNGGRVSVTVSSSFDVQLSARTACEDSATQTVCSDNQTNIVVADLAAGETVFVILDAFNATASSAGFTVTVAEATFRDIGEACSGTDICLEGFCSTTCQAFDELEPNEDGTPQTGGSGTAGNDFNATSAAEVVANVTANGFPVITATRSLFASLQIAGDEDVFAIQNTTAAAMSLVVETVGVDGTTCTFDTGINVRSAAGAVLVNNDDDGVGSCSRAAFTLPAGETVYAHVVEFGDNAAINYMLNVTLN